MLDKHFARSSFALIIERRRYKMIYYIDIHYNALSIAPLFALHFYYTLLLVKLHITMYRMPSFRFDIIDGL